MSETASRDALGRAGSGYGLPEGVAEGLKGPLFRVGWLLFFAGVPFLDWSAPGVLLVLIHWAWTGSALKPDLPPGRGYAVYRVAVLGVVAAYGLSLIPAVNRVHALAESIGFGMLLLFGLTYALRMESAAPGWWHRFLWPVPLTGTAAAVVGLWQDYQLRPYGAVAPRISGVHENPNAYSTAIMFGLFLGLAALSRYKDWRRWLAIPYVGLLGAAMLTTGSRGAWVGTMVGFGLYGLFRLVGHWRLRQYRRLVLTVAAALLLVLVLGLVYNAANPWTQARIGSIIDVDANKDRVVLWETMVRLIQDNPWLGVGMGNIKHRFAEYQVDTRRETFGTAHNFVLQFLGEIGIFGGIFIALLLIVWFVWGRPGVDASTARVLLYCMLGALFARDLFDNSLTNFYVFFVANWLGGTLVGARSTLRKEP